MVHNIVEFLLVASLGVGLFGCSVGIIAHIQEWERVEDRCMLLAAVCSTTSLACVVLLMAVWR